jgi:hypothetical protein
MKCSYGAQVLLTVNALYKMDDITYIVLSEPTTLAVIASGGVAGNGDVVYQKVKLMGSWLRHLPLQTWIQMIYYKRMSSKSSMAITMDGRQCARIPRLLAKR